MHLLSKKLVAFFSCRQSALESDTTEGESPVVDDERPNLFLLWSRVAWECCVKWVVNFIQT